MRTVKLTQAHVGRKVRIGSDGRFYEGSIVGLDDDGTFYVHVTGHGAWTFSSLSKVGELETVTDPDFQWDLRVILLPSKEERQVMEIHGFLNFLSQNGVVLARSPEDDPLNPVAVPPALLDNLLRTYFGGK